MAINHLIKIRNFLKKNKNKEFNLREIRDSLNVWYGAAIESVMYLEFEEKSIKRKVLNKNKVVYYWKK